MHTRELFDLSGNVAIVTGGSVGLGRQMAQALAECGSDVVVCARDARRCDEAAAELSSCGVRALGIGCDIRDENDIARVVDRTCSEFGRIDVLVNNAGTTWSASPEDLTLEAWNKVIDVNVTGTFLFSQAASRAMIDQDHGGRIINIASIAAFKGARPEVMNALPYNTSKGAVVSLTQSLALEWAPHGIMVNAIAPGWFPSEMSEVVLERSGEMLRSDIPLGRFGGHDDLKGAVVFLASAASAFVTGMILIVDGGQVVSKSGASAIAL